MKQVKYVVWRDENGLITVLVKASEETRSRRIGHIHRIVHEGNSNDVHRCADDLIEWFDGRSDVLFETCHEAPLRVIQAEIERVVNSVKLEVPKPVKAKALHSGEFAHVPPDEEMPRNPHARVYEKPNSTPARLKLSDWMVFQIISLRKRYGLTNPQVRRFLKMRYGVQLPKDHSSGNFLAYWPMSQEAPLTDGEEADLRRKGNPMYHSEFIPIQRQWYSMHGGSR